MPTIRTLRRLTVFLGSGALALAASADLLPGSSVDLGRKTFTANCFPCHGNRIQPGEINVPNYVPTPEAIRSAMNRIIPMRGAPSLASLTDTDLSNISLYLSKPSTTDADRAFDWGEHTYPGLLVGPVQTGSQAGYTFRFYSGSNTYIGAQGDVSTDGHLFFYSPANGSGIVDLGTQQSFLATVQAGGF
jgi:hypothetical protein